MIRGLCVDESQETEEPNVSASYSILQLPVRLDGQTGGELEGRLRSGFPESVQHLVLDMSTVEFISSAGIRFLILAANHFRKRGGSVLLCSPGTAVSQVLQITGLTTTFPIHADVKSAVNSVSAESL